MKKILKILVISMIVLCCFFVGCDDNSTVYYDNYGSNTDYEVVEKSVSNSKIIKRTFNYDLQYKWEEIAEVSNNIKSKTAELSGEVLSFNKYESKSNVYNYVRLKIKVPTDKLEEFLEYISGLNVDSKSENSVDITDYYNSLKDDKESLEEKMEIYNEFYNDEKATISDKLNILDRLQDVRKQLESINKKIEPYETTTSYTLIDIMIEDDDCGCECGCEAGFGTAIIIIFFVFLLSGTVLIIVSTVKIIKNKKKTNQNK